MKRIICLVLVMLVSCSKDTLDASKTLEEPFFFNSVDLSLVPKLRKAQTVFFDQNKKPKDLLDLLTNAGVNTVRLRIWVSPATEDSSFEEVKNFSKELREKGMKLWLTVHYSDTWADPGSQQLPNDWNGGTYQDILDNVFVYTKRIMEEIAPDIIQIGNEVNHGFLFPYGDIYKNQNQFLELLSVGIQAVRAVSDTCKIMIHVAGTSQADWFFGRLVGLDFDMIGISYYPKWHGKNLEEFELEFKNLSQKYDKEILIAETSYPFTLDWNDWTHNVMGDNEALILPNYPATEQGQLKFLQKIKEIALTTEKGIGFCYWGAASVAFDGNESTKGSSWENQAIFDFNNNVLPVINVFNMK